MAVRMSAHPVFRAVIERVRPPARPHPVPTASDALARRRAHTFLPSLSGRIPLILEAGPTAHGLESTVILPAGDGTSHPHTAPWTDHVRNARGLRAGGSDSVRPVTSGAHKSRPRSDRRVITHQAYAGSSLPMPGSGNINIKVGRPGLLGYRARSAIRHRRRSMPPCGGVSQRRRRPARGRHAAVCRPASVGRRGVGPDRRR